ncbi:MAG: hypothetical protein GF353_28485 [Candidatus Lokiarchaeota archaeon]|nr:hypothetical protein [Candidatus Lokiarchaeota archaeon]
MPVGLVLFKWDDLEGNVILTKFPPSLSVSEKNLNQIFDTHELSGEKGVISLMVGELNAISYYSGAQSKICITLLLNIDDDPDEFENGLVDISQQILLNIENRKYIQFFPALYKKLINYPRLSEEQYLLMALQNMIIRSILKILRDVGFISKSKLKGLIFEKFNEEYVDLDSILFEMVQKELIEIASVRGEKELFIFLINDIVCFRIPPFRLMENPSDYGLPKQLKEDYIARINEFFKVYHVSKQEKEEITDLLNNLDIYSMFATLRNKICRKLDFNKEGLKEETDKLIDRMIKIQIVECFEYKENTLYALKTDFFIEKLIPEYALNTIKMYYEKNLQSPELLIKYLEILNNTYHNSREE